MICAGRKEASKSPQRCVRLALHSSDLKAGIRSYTTRQKPYTISFQYWHWGARVETVPRCVVSGRDVYPRYSRFGFVAAKLVFGKARCSSNDGPSTVISRHTVFELKLLQVRAM